MANNVTALLDDLKLGQYVKKFKDYGVENLADLRDFGEDDWLALDVKTFHRKRILARVAELTAHTTSQQQGHGQQQNNTPPVSTDPEYTQNILALITEITSPFADTPGEEETTNNTKDSHVGAGSGVTNRSAPRAVNNNNVHTPSSTASASLTKTQKPKELGGSPATVEEDMKASPFDSQDENDGSSTSSVAKIKAALYGNIGKKGANTLASRVIPPPPVVTSTKKAPEPSASSPNGKTPTDLKKSESAGKSPVYLPSPFEAPPSPFASGPSSTITSQIPSNPFALDLDFDSDALRKQLSAGSSLKSPKPLPQPKVTKSRGPSTPTSPLSGSGTAQSRSNTKQILSSSLPASPSIGPSNVPNSKSGSTTPRSGSIPPRPTGSPLKGSNPEAIPEAVLRPGIDFPDFPTSGNYTSDDDDEEPSEASPARYRRMGTSLARGQKKYSEDAEQEADNPDSAEQSPRLDGSPMESPRASGQPAKFTREFIRRPKPSRVPHPPVPKMAISEKPSLAELSIHLRPPGKELNVSSSASKALPRAFSTSLINISSRSSSVRTLPDQTFKDGDSDENDEGVKRTPSLSGSRDKIRDEAKRSHSSSFSKLSRSGEDSRSKHRAVHNMKSHSKDSSEMKSIIGRSKPTTKVKKELPDLPKPQQQYHVPEFPTDEDDVVAEPDIPPPFMGWAIALYDNDEGENELVFKEGDKIKIIRTDDSGWWTGEIHGKTGFFPANYVRQIFDAND